jgi:hypothetical protein
MDEGEIRRVECTAHFDAELQSIAINPSGHPLKNMHKFSARFSIPRLASSLIPLGGVNACQGFALPVKAERDVADTLQVSIFVREWANMSFRIQFDAVAHRTDKNDGRSWGEADNRGRKLNFGVALAVIGVST